MHIRSFHVDTFGILSSLTVEGLSPHINIFLGQNEAGKSTCLEFLRTMLTGYPRMSPFGSSRGGQSGGYLLLDTEHAGLLRLTRRPGAKGGLVTLTDTKGAPCDSTLLDQIMGNITREVYRNVYGFSLSELQCFDSLNDDAVRNALYGASFGAGHISPAEILKSLQSELDKLFKPNGKNQSLNMRLTEREALRQEIQNAQAESALYDALAAERIQTEQALTAQRARYAEEDINRRALERRLGVWRQWEEWHFAGLKLERLTDITDTFPFDGQNRMERLVEKQDEAMRQTELLRNRIAATWHNLEELPLDDTLLQATGHIRSLAERKASYANALASLPTLYDAQAQNVAEQNRQLKSLGNEWNIERIKSTDRSLFTHEKLERNAEAMQIARTEYHATLGQVEKISQDVHASLAELKRAEEILAELPSLDDVPDEESREAIKRAFALAEEAQQRLSDRKVALIQARTEYNRSLVPLRLRPQGLQAAQNTLDSLVESQDDALELARTAQSYLAQEEEARQELRQAREAEEQARTRVERMQRQRAAEQAHDRNSLEHRGQALRRLRRLNAQLDTENERLAELDESTVTQRISLPKRQYTLPLLVLGIILVLAGFAMLGIRLYTGLDVLTLNPGLYVPLNSWSAYLVIFAGCAFLVSGSPHAGPEAARQRNLIEQFEARSQTTRMQIHDLETQMTALCTDLQIEKVDSYLLDSLEIQLEREREQCVSDEHIQQEIQNNADEFTRLHEHSQRLENSFTQAESHIQAARRKWHECMENLGISTVPAPEQAVAFFARVDAARTCRSTLNRIEAEIATFELQIKNLEDLLKAVPMMSGSGLQSGSMDFPSETEFDISGNKQNTILENARRFIALCRDADMVTEKRRQAEEQHRAARTLLERSEQLHGQATATLHENEERFAQCTAIWKNSLEQLGLDSELSPTTVREALECMDSCLSLEADNIRLAAETVRQENECAALEQPLEDLLKTLDISPALNPDGTPHWLLSLENLQCALETARTNAEEKRHLNTVLESQTKELQDVENTLQHAQSAIQQMLDLAKLETIEDFFCTASRAMERAALLARRQDLEDALALAAAGTPLDEFLEEFIHTDQSELESRAVACTTLLQDLEAESHTLSDKLGTLRAKLETLTSTNKLAELRHQESALEESLRKEALDWSRLTMARHLLETAKKHFEQERQPKVIKIASEIFAEITGGTWQSIVATLEDTSLNVLSSELEPLAAEKLSRGTQEQLYLALRLAYIRNHAELAAPLPLILDDILVNFDPQRAMRTASAFQKIAGGNSETPAHQMLYYTCHPHVVEMLQSIAPDAPLYTIEKGHIHAL